jgi:hypothetical protein
MLSQRSIISDTLITSLYTINRKNLSNNYHCYVSLSHYFKYFFIHRIFINFVAILRIILLFNTLHIHAKTFCKNNYNMARLLQHIA